MMKFMQTPARNELTTGLPGKNSKYADSSAANKLATAIHSFNVSAMLAHLDCIEVVFLHRHSVAADHAWEGTFAVHLRRDCA